MAINRYKPLCFFLIIFVKNVHSQRILDEIIKRSIPEDGRLNFTELSEKHGHKSEVHKVTTEDGYILQLFRLKGNESNPVLLMHGLLDSADTFIIRGKNSLAIALADAGYDVWVGNCRGNKYARRHLTLDPDLNKKSFWDFSFHEFGVHDSPAMIDFILETTRQTQVVVIGHSQGNLLHYVLGAEKPEYNAKIRLLIALAPICHLNNLRDLAKILALAWPAASNALKVLNIEEILRDDSFLNKFAKATCSQRFGYVTCAEGVVFPITGRNPDELEPEFFPVVVGHFPAGTSRKVADHQEQLASKKEFTRFDYGTFGNLIKYRSSKAPKYDLDKVTMPVAMLAGQNDNIATIEDIKVLRGQLPNVVYYHEMEDKQTNHIDFVWGRNMKGYLFPLIFDLLEKY